MKNKLLSKIIPEQLIQELEPHKIDIDIKAKIFTETVTIPIEIGPPLEFNGHGSFDDMND